MPLRDREAKPSKLAPGSLNLMTPSEAADFLRVSRATIYLWVRQNRLRCLRAGTRLRFDPADLERFVRGV